MAGNKPTRFSKSKRLIERLLSRPHLGKRYLVVSSVAMPVGRTQSDTAPVVTERLRMPSAKSGAYRFIRPTLPQRGKQPLLLRISGSWRPSNAGNFLSNSAIKQSGHDS
jgi:hypothetical protein